MAGWKGSYQKSELDLHAAFLYTDYLQSISAGINEMFRTDKDD
jgi:hypothetical protein